jgi:hypothetical protein
LKPTNLVEDTTITQDSTVFKHSVENMTNKSAKVEGYEKEDENLTEIGKSDIWLQNKTRTILNNTF